MIKINLWTEPPDPRPKHDRSHEGKDSSTKVNNARPRKVLELADNEESVDEKIPFG